MDKHPNICTWIGNHEGCRHPTILGKSYCEKHHERMYVTLFPEMADFIIEKELGKDNAHRALVKFNR